MVEFDTFMSNTDQCSFNTVRLAPEEESAKLTGYEHNAVTCVGLKTEIPVVIFLLSFYLS